MEKFALIFLVFIATVILVVLVKGGSWMTAAIAGSVLLLIFFGLRRIRRERQEHRLEDPDAGEMTEPMPGEEPLKPG